MFSIYYFNFGKFINFFFNMVLYCFWNVFIPNLNISWNYDENSPVQVIYRLFIHRYYVVGAFSSFKPKWTRKPHRRNGRRITAVSSCPIYIFPNCKELNCGDRVQISLAAELISSYIVFKAQIRCLCPNYTPKWPLWLTVVLWLTFILYHVFGIVYSAINIARGAAAAAAVTTTRRR